MDKESKECFDAERETPGKFDLDEHDLRNHVDAWFARKSTEEASAPSWDLTHRGNYTDAAVLVAKCSTSNPSP
jgi:hypothetical protein